MKNIHNNEKHIYYYNLANQFKDKNQFHKAIEYYKKVIDIQSDFLDAYCNLAYVYNLLNNYELSIKYYKIAIKKNPNSLYLYRNLAILYDDINQLDKSLELLNIALKLDKQNIDTMYNLSIVLLKNNNYIDGFKYFRARYKIIKSEPMLLQADRLLQKNQNIKNKIIYIYREQGLGDMIQFIRFLPSFYKAGAKIICYMPLSLIKLFSINYPLVKFLDNPKTASGNYHFGLMESAYLLNLRYNKIPKKYNYLKVIQSDSMNIAKRYFSNIIKVKIGIIWRSNIINKNNAKVHKNKKQRSIILQNFLHNFKNNNTQLYSLQLETTKQENEILKQNNIFSFEKIINNFYDTASIIDNLDVIISIDTSVVHLSAAMGKPTFVLVPYSCDWRWGYEGNKTNWYDSITICRQKKLGDWNSAFIEAKEELDLFIKTQVKTKSLS